MLLSATSEHVVEKRDCVAALCREERLNAAERASCAPGYGCNSSTLIKLLAVLCRRIALPSGPGIDMSIDVVDRVELRSRSPFVMSKTISPSPEGAVR
jgi:hypothetical protein